MPAPTATAASAGALGAALATDATSDLVVAPREPGPGAWAGAPTALLHEGIFYLAYRLRRPIGHGRGVANVIARSTDGVHLDTIGIVSKEPFGAESLERPALVVTPDGRWRLYVSVATPGTKHWRVDVLEADSPERLATARARTVLPGSDALAVKDPVIARYDGRWHLWASCHPLDDPAHTDRMTTEYATSDDGLDWTWQGTALRGRAGSWDERGARVSAVLLDGLSGSPEPVALYDGRATAEQNWEEQTGLAVIEDLGRLRAVGDEPVGVSGHGLGGLRYATAVRLPHGGVRLWFERTRDDGAHELRTTVVPDR